MLRIAIFSLFVAVLSASFVAEAQAGGCCPSCGCHKLKKVCKPVCVVKKETKVTYDCVCEDFCVPGPSKCVGYCKTKDCRGCVHCKPMMQPTCAAVRTRSKLIKHTEEIEKPTIQWVVQTVCCGCGCVCNDGNGGCTAGGCAQGCADGACTHGGPVPTEAPAESPAPPLPPSPMKEAVYGPPTGSVLTELLSEPQ